MAIFATVVQRRAMRVAAQELGMTPSAVSQQIRALEQAIGVTLLHRSTRRLSLTEAGERYYTGCAAMLAAARSAEDALASLRDEPEGELRLAAPVGFARWIGRTLGPLLAAHPRLTLSLRLEDTPTDLIGERIDLALRVGEWADSSLVARRIGAMALIVVAAPEYLARRGQPHAPGDLAAHDWLLARPLGAAAVRSLHLKGPAGATTELRPAARVFSNDHLSLQQMCIAGLGLAAFAAQDVTDDLASGRLVRVLPEWASAPLGIHAVTPRRDAQPAKVRHAVLAFQAALSAGGQITG